MASKQVAGEIGEFHVFGELLKQGVAVYKPRVDEGLDALARLPDGQVLELQIKSSGGAGGKYHHWFQMPAFTPRHNYFIVCVAFSETSVAEVWVFPSTVFFAYAAGRKDKIRDLNLDSGIRKYGETLRDHLCGFRNRWELISNFEKWRGFMTSPEGFEDLEDILAMKEALETPERRKNDLRRICPQIPRPGMSLNLTVDGSTGNCAACPPNTSGEYDCYRKPG